MKILTEQDALVTKPILNVVEQNSDKISMETYMQLLNNILTIANRLANAAKPNEYLQRLYANAQNIYENTNPSLKGRFSCKKGCAFCCHIQVVISEVEGQYMLDYAAENNIPVDWAHLEKQHSLQEGNHSDSRYSRCAFLQPDNSCGIYDARPMSCRKYIVINKPKFCDSVRYKSGKTMVHFDVNTETIASGIATGGGKQDSIARTLLSLKK